MVGRNEITPAVDRKFRRDEELIVVFLVYNPMVTTDRQFDVKVEYHFYRKVELGAQTEPVGLELAHSRHGRESGTSIARIHSASIRR